MILQLEHISKSFSGRVLFHDVTFNLRNTTAWRSSLERCRQTTILLNIISGEEDADEGRVLFAKGARVGYLEQEPSRWTSSPSSTRLWPPRSRCSPPRKRLRALEESLGENPPRATFRRRGDVRDEFERLGGYVIEAKVRGVLFGLGFKEDDMRRMTSEFSGGWQMRIALAKLLIRNPEVLLLDEPTNHLDLESVKWLESFLRSYSGTVIVVSHDRAFMDNMVDRVAEVDNQQVNLYKGNYTAYLRQRAERIERLKQERTKQIEEMKRLEAFVEKFRYKATKARQAQERAAKLQRS